MYLFWLSFYWGIPRAQDRTQNWKLLGDVGRSYSFSLAITHYYWLYVPPILAMGPLLISPPLLPMYSLVLFLDIYSLTKTSKDPKSVPVSPVASCSVTWPYLSHPHFFQVSWPCGLSRLVFPSHCLPSKQAPICLPFLWCCTWPRLPLLYSYLPFVLYSHWSCFLPKYFSYL